MQICRKEFPFVNVHFDFSITEQNHTYFYLSLIALIKSRKSEQDVSGKQGTMPEDQADQRDTVKLSAKPPKVIAWVFKITAEINHIRI